MADSITPTLAQQWSASLEEVTQRIGPRFARSEPRQRMRRYLEGLLSPVERKNGWQLAEAAGETTPYGMQRLLAARSGMRTRCAMTCPPTSWSNWGSARDPGDRRDGLSQAGRQIGGREAAVQRNGGADRELPDRRLSDLRRARGTRAARPRTVSAARVGRRPRPPPGGGRARECDVCHQARTGASHARTRADSRHLGGLGHRRQYLRRDRRLRVWLEQQEQPFVLAVARNEPLWAVVEDQWGQYRADVVAAHAPAEQWRRLSAGPGAKGPRRYDWAVVPLARLQLSAEERRWAHALLIRRSLSDPTDWRTMSSSPRWERRSRHW